MLPDGRQYAGMKFSPRVKIVATAVALSMPATASAQQVRLGSGSVVQTVTSLRPGEYVWEPGLAPAGPMILIVNTTTQRGVLFRNGIPIAATTLSTGRPGYRTPTGVFTVLQKHVEHYSRKYDNAPMPYMQRLTWYGVALHAGHLPGYPASHGCIRLPKEFARLLYGITSLGMTVIVTDLPATPRVAPTPDIALGRSQPPQADATIDWHPDKSPTGPVSIIVSTADGRAIVLRNGLQIGSGPVSVDRAPAGTWAYALRSAKHGDPQWIRVQLSAPTGAEEVVAVPREEWQMFRASEQFRNAVAQVIGPGTTIVVTSDSLQGPASLASAPILENDDK
jgi:hypothetical protein